MDPLFWNTAMHIFSFLTSALDRGQWSDSFSSWFTLRRKATPTHQGTGSWVDPRNSLKVLQQRKILCPAGNRISIPPLSSLQPGFHTIISQLICCMNHEEIHCTPMEFIYWLQISSLISILTILSQHNCCINHEEIHLTNGIHTVTANNPQGPHNLTDEK